MSTDTYGFPKELGLQIALKAFHAFLLKHEMEIILVVFGPEAFRISGKIFEDVREYVEHSYVERKRKQEYRNEGFSGPNVTRMEVPCQSIPFENHKRESVVFQYLRSDSEACKTTDIDFYLREETGSFGEYLQQMIHKKGMKNVEVYTAANLTKQYFSKLLKGKVTPSKTKILSLAIALQLNLDETIDFLRMSEYAFSPFSQVDKIFEYFIRNKIYDIYRIDIVLFDYGLPTLVND